MGQSVDSNNVFSINNAIELKDLSLMMIEELALAKLLIKFDEVLLEVSRDLYPNKVNSIVVIMISLSLLYAFIVV